MNAASIIFLWPLALLYEFAVFCRKLWYAFGFVKPYKADIPVISIGNITAGGTGKTPMAIHIAQVLMRHGLRVAVLSRGYKRENEGRDQKTKTQVVSDGAALKCSVAEAGDEPYLIATRLLGTLDKPGAMVIVGKDRVASARQAIALSAQVIVLDDAFQYWRIKRDLDIVLLDAERPFGNGWALPAGRLREPVSALQRADALVLTRWQDGRAIDHGLASIGLPVYRTRHGVQGLARWERGTLRDAGIAEVKQGKTLLFSGIARHESFEQCSGQLGIRSDTHLKYNDHHRYSKSDLGRITAAANKYDALITTEKDAVRLPRDWDPGKPLYVLRVGIEFIGDAGTFETMVLSSLRK